MNPKHFTIALLVAILAGGVVSQIPSVYAAQPALSCAYERDISTGGGTHAFSIAATAGAVYVVYSNTGDGNTTVERISGACNQVWEVEFASGYGRTESRGMPNIVILFDETHLLVNSGSNQLARIDKANGDVDQTFSKAAASVLTVWVDGEFAPPRPGAVYTTTTSLVKYILNPTTSTFFLPHQTLTPDPTYNIGYNIQFDFIRQDAFFDASRGASTVRKIAADDSNLLLAQTNLPLGANTLKGDIRFDGDGNVVFCHARDISPYRNGFTVYSVAGMVQQATLANDLNDVNTFDRYQPCFVGASDGVGLCNIDSVAQKPRVEYFDHAGVSNWTITDTGATTNSNGVISCDVDYNGGFWLGWADLGDRIRLAHYTSTSGTAGAVEPPPSILQNPPIVPGSTATPTPVAPGDDFLTASKGRLATAFGWDSDTAGWIFGLVIVGGVMLVAARHGLTAPVAIGIIGLLGVGIAFQMGLLPAWFLVLIIFVVIAAAGSAWLGGKNGGDS